MPLKDFLNNTSTGIKPQTGGSLSNYLNKKQTPSAPVTPAPTITPTAPKSSSTKTTTPAVVAKKDDKPSIWQRLSKQLMKPVGAVAAETEAIGKVLTQSPIKAIASGEYKPGKGALDVLSGHREYSFSKLWDDYYVKPMTESGNKTGANVGRAMGLMTDIAADPLNFIGGGLTKAGKLAEKVSSLTKNGQVIKKGSAIWNQAKKLGYSIEELKLAGSKVEQAQQGQRAFLQVFGKPIITGEKIYEKTGKLTDFLKTTPAFEKVSNIFSAKSGIKELDDMVDGYKNLADYKKQQVIETAGKIQEQIKTFGVEKTKLLIEAIENPEIKATLQDNKILNIANQIEGLFKEMKVTEKSKGILKSELENYFPHIKIKEEGLKGTIDALFNPKTWSVKAPFAKERTISGTIQEINNVFGKEFFQSNPVLAYAQRGLASSKAVTAREFLEEAGKKFFVADKDAPISFVESTNPIFKGMKAPEKVVKAVDQYVKGIQPEELKAIVKGFDAVQNWWKAEVLISPSYHMRNMVGNFWNNWLAGVSNPAQYLKARAVQGGKNMDEIFTTTQAGEQLSKAKVLEEAKKHGIIGSGWYGKDIQSILNDEISGRWKGITDKMKQVKGWNPFSRNNWLIQSNQAIGSAIEDNARLAHFIDQVEKGYSFADAAKSVKKYLFDYSDLSWTEKNIFKRIAPFYTWTRKNVPLQIENLITQPAKFALLPKVIEQIEQGVPTPASEKYMSDYLKENIPVRFRKNKDGNFEYFMLGNWLPSANAIDFLSQPLENIINMVTPLAKTPYELWANQSLFFKNTLGEPSQIEYYYKQPTEFIGIPMRRKVAQVLRNVRVLNDFNTFIAKGDKDDPKNSPMVKFLNVFFGKSVTYDVGKAKDFYKRDTDQRVSDFKAAIKKAKQLGQSDHAQKLAEELKQFQKERSSSNNINSATTTPSKPFKIEKLNFSENGIPTAKTSSGNTPIDKIDLNSVPSIEPIKSLSISLGNDKFEVANPEQLKVANRIKQIADFYNPKYTNYLLKLARFEGEFDDKKINTANKDGSIDRGVFQINNKAFPQISDEQATNLDFSILWALSLIESGKQNKWVANDSAKQATILTQ